MGGCVWGVAEILTERASGALGMGMGMGNDGVN